MSNLTKIRDVSVKYGISARTLRYYEDIGLLDSTRGTDNAYRLYDEMAVKRLEQILILRKLNIGIKDIQRIFNTAGSETVLEVLGQKVSDIDEEVALLHELREIITAFIRQIEQVDFSKDSDVKLLYSKAKEIETQLVEYSGNPATVHRLFEVAEKLDKKAVSRLNIPDNILKRLLQNVYFVLGDGAAVADELGRRHGMHVYHTCDHRYKHCQNADPKFQPELSCAIGNADFWARDPEDAMRHEREVVHDFTPMVIMDLIQLTANDEKVICENDIDIESILPIVTNAIVISNERAWDDFLSNYENEIHQRDINEEEKSKLVRKLHVVWGKGKPENPHGVNAYGLKQIFLDDNSTVAQTANIVAEYFGLSNDALEFIAHLRNIEGFSVCQDENDAGKWWINSKENLVCEVQIEDTGGDWQVWVYGDCIGGHDLQIDEKTKEITWANITFCGSCGAECAPGRRKTVFGREFDNVCQSTLVYKNPNADMLDCLKKVAVSLNC